MKEFLFSILDKKSALSISEKLKCINYTDPIQLHILNESEIASLEGISEINARFIYKTICNAKSRDMFGTIPESHDYRYLSTEIASLNKKLKIGYRKGTGFRSQSIVQIHGPPNSGQDEFLFSMATKVLSPKGWSGKVVQLSSRFRSNEQLDRVNTYHNIEPQIISDNFHSYQVADLFELDTQLKYLPLKVDLIIIDDISSIIGAAHSDTHTYGYSDPRKITERNALLHNIMRKLRRIAITYDAIIIIVNQEEQDDGNIHHYLQYQPKLHLELGYSCDIELRFSKAKSYERKQNESQLIPIVDDRWDGYLFWLNRFYSPRLQRICKAINIKCVHSTNHMDFEAFAWVTPFGLFDGTHDYKLIGLILKELDLLRVIARNKRELEELGAKAKIIQQRQKMMEKTQFILNALAS